MKATINGFRYDTDKATEIGYASHGYQGDFSHWTATLYVTKRAKHFFLAGEGGPMTRWARRVEQNSYSSGEGIVVLSREEALEWAQQNLTVDEIEAGFAADIQDA